MYGMLWLMNTVLTIAPPSPPFPIPLYPRSFQEGPKGTKEEPTIPPRAFNRRPRDMGHTICTGIDPNSAQELPKVGQRSEEVTPLRGPNIGA